MTQRYHWWRLWVWPVTPTTLLSPIVLSFTSKYLDLLKKWIGIYLLQNINLPIMKCKSDLNPPLIAVKSLRELNSPCLSFLNCKLIIIKSTTEGVYGDDKNETTGSQGGVQNATEQSNISCTAASLMEVEERCWAKWLWNLRGWKQRKLHVSTALDWWSHFPRRYGLAAGVLLHRDTRMESLSDWMADGRDLQISKYWGLEWAMLWWRDNSMDSSID